MAVRYAEIAEHLVDQLGPFCERVEIAGSIRRGKRDPKDIEIVCVPQLAEVERIGQIALGATPATEPFNILDHKLDEWKQVGILRDRKGSDGKRAWGSKFKRALYMVQDRPYPVDIFSVIAPAQWGVIFAIRTGPEEFSKAFVTSRLQGGYLPSDMQVRGGQLLHGGGPVATPEESDFFRAIGIPCWAPEERSLEGLQAWRAETTPPYCEDCRGHS